jgi:hypothetical protein
MNRNQKIVVVSAIAVATLMLLFPPFQYINRVGTFHAGYGFLLLRPETGPAVNLGLLLMQWVIVGLIGGVAFYLLKE